MLGNTLNVFWRFAIALAITGQFVVGQIGIKSPQMPLAQNLVHYYNGSFPLAPVANSTFPVGYYNTNNMTSHDVSSHQNFHTQNATFNFINKTLGSRPTGICFKEVP